MCIVPSEVFSRYWSQKKCYEKSEKEDNAIESHENTIRTVGTRRGYSLGTMVAVKKAQEAEDKTQLFAEGCVIPLFLNVIYVFDSRILSGGFK